MPIIALHPAWLPKISGRMSSQPRYGIPRMVPRSVVSVYPTTCQADFLRTLISTLACPPPPITTMLSMAQPVDYILNIRFFQVYAARDVQRDLQHPMGFLDVVVKAVAVGRLQVVQMPDGPCLDATLL